jgi:hypothetical protein
LCDPSNQERGDQVVCPRVTHFFICRADSGRTKRLSLYALSASSAGEHLGKFKTGRGAKGRGRHRDGRKEEMEQMSRRKRRRGVKYEQDEAEHGKM